MTLTPGCQPSFLAVYLGSTAGLRMPARSRWIGPTVRLLSRSELDHVAICQDGALLNPGVRHDTIWPELLLLGRYPGLFRWRITVPTDRRVDLDRLATGCNKVTGLSLLRWATGGLTWAQDCVCTALIALNDAGVPAPDDIVTPAGLARWLLWEGYACEQLGTAPAERGSDPRARRGDPGGGPEGQPPVQRGGQAPAGA